MRHFFLTTSARQFGFTVVKEANEERLRGEKVTVQVTPYNLTRKTITKHSRKWQ